MDPKDTISRLEAAHALLKESSTSRGKFESIRTLIKGINPRLDKLLADCSSALSTIDKLQKGDVIEVSADLLPEETEKEKKRKKAILLFIRSWKQLHDEVHRMKTELTQASNDSSPGDRALRTGKIITTAKGPLGIITIAALGIAAVLIWTNKPQQTPVPQFRSPGSDGSAQTIEVIEFEGNQIAVSELAVLTGPDCVNGTRQVPHYHAAAGNQVRTTDGSVLQDPGGCAFGKVSETTIRTVPGPIR